MSPLHQPLGYAKLQTRFLLINKPNHKYYAKHQINQHQVPVLPKQTMHKHAIAKKKKCKGKKIGTA